MDKITFGREVKRYYWKGEEKQQFFLDLPSKSLSLGYMEEH